MMVTFMNQLTLLIKDTFTLLLAVPHEVRYAYFLPKRN